MKYTNYIFDLYGTLVNIETNEDQDSLWESIAKLYSCFGANYTGSELQASYAKLCQAEKETFTCEYPEICLDNVFRNLFVEKGVLPEESLVYYIGNTFRCLSRSVFALYPGITETLQTLKKQGKHVYLLSNAQRIFTYQELSQLGILPYFDGIFISSDHGIKKPDPAYMNKLLDTYSLKKEDSVMIGNEIQTDITIANACGMDSLYIRSQDFEPLPQTVPATYQILDGDFLKLSELLTK